MATDKKQDDLKQQTTQGHQPINPFKEEAPKADPEQQKADDIALEQQRKEALTERD